TLGTVLTQLKDVVVKAAGYAGKAFQEGAADCPEKLAELDSASFKEVLSCVKEAALKALDVAKLSAARAGISKIIELAATGGKKALPQVTKFLGLFKKLSPDLAGITTVITGMGDAVIDSFKEGAAACPDKLTAFDKDSAMAVIDCLKEAAGAAPEAAADKKMKEAEEKEKEADAKTKAAEDEADAK